MRTLKFIVDKQIIKPDPSCDFSGLVPGTDGYLQAEFSFSEDWNGCSKVVGFWSRVGKECPPKVLENSMTCMIPKEALVHKYFTMQVIGKREGFRIATNRLIVTQDGGAV